MKFLIINILLILNLSVVFFKANASPECTRFLATSETYFINIPGRGHQFTKTDFDQLEPGLQYRILALKDALNVLNHPTVIEVLKTINQPLDYYLKPGTEIKIPSELKAIIQNQAVEKTVEDHFRFFSSQLMSLNPQDFSERTLVGLSLLFSQIQRPRTSLTTMLQVIDRPTELTTTIFNRFLDDINKPKYAKAIVTFLKNPIAQEITQDILAASHEDILEAAEDRIAEYARVNKISIEKSRYLYKENMVKKLTLDVRKTEDDFRKGKKFSSEQSLHLSALLGEFIEMLVHHYDSNTKGRRKFFGLLKEKYPPFYKVPRPLRLTIIEDYLTNYSGFRYGLEDLTDFFDHLMFGSSLPLRIEDLESSINQSIKSWLMPVRTQISLLHTKAQTHMKAASDKPTHIRDWVLNSDFGHSPRESKVVTQQAPALNPNKRKNQKRSENHEQSQNDELTANQDFESLTPNQIPNDLDLIQFTSYAEQARPLSELRSSVTYQFRFMRDGADSRIYTITFEHDAIKDLLNIPEIGSQLIRSLNLGFAKSIHEDGLKILRANKKGQPGRFYELKYRKSDVRVIMHHLDGHWRFIRVTDKLNLDRIISSYL